MKPSPRWIYILLLGVLLFVGSQVLFSPKDSLNERLERQDPLIIHYGDTVKATVQPSWFKPQTYGAMIECLEWHESRGDEEAIGQAGEKGVLQFMPTTFQELCVDKLGLPNDIWDADNQRRCADYLLQDNWNYIYRWTTYKFCT